MAVCGSVWLIYSFKNKKACFDKNKNGGYSHHYNSVITDLTY